MISSISDNLWVQKSVERILKVGLESGYPVVDAVARLVRLVNLVDEEPDELATLLAASFVVAVAFSSYFANEGAASAFHLFFDGSEGIAECIAIRGRISAAEENRLLAGEVLSLSLGEEAFPIVL